MHKRIVVAVLKYGVGLSVLVWVVWSHWSRPQDNRPALAASTVGLGASPFTAPVNAAAGAFPGRPPGRDIGIVGVLERPVRLEFLLLAAGVSVGCVLITFVRWYILVRSQGLPFNIPSAIRLGLVGYYYSICLPGSVGGDLIKAACIAWEQSRRTVAVATVVVDRIVGLCGLIWLVSILGSVFWVSGALRAMASPENVSSLETIVLGAIALSSASVVFWLGLGWIPEGLSRGLAAMLERVPVAGHALGELWRAQILYRRRGRDIALTLIMSIFTHAGFVLSFYWAALSLCAAAEIPSLGTHYLIVPVGMMIKGFFPAPGGVGGGEYGFGSLYQLVHYPFAFGVLASLAQRVIEWGGGFAGYLVYLRMRPRLPKNDPETTELPRPIADETGKKSLQSGRENATI